MKTCRIILCTLILTSVCWATTTKPSPSPVLSLAPADALAIVYLDKPADLLQHPVVVKGVEQPEPRAVLKAAAEAFFGPTMLAVCGTPMNLAEFRVELATRPSLPEVDFFKKLDEEVLPSVGKVVFAGVAGQVGSSGLLRTIRFPGPIPITVFVAAKNGIVYGSSRRADAEAWLEGAEMPERFVDSDECERLFGDRSKTPDVLAYFNARLIVPLAQAEFDRSTLPGLFATLGLDRLESAGLTVQWSAPSVGARLTVALADGEGGLPALLAPRNAPLVIPSLLPSDYTFFVRGAFHTAAETSALEDILDAVDPDIAREYAQECREFRDEFGFDPHEDFLANLVDEWLIAGRIVAEGSPSWVAAVRLADPTVFQAHLATLAAAFNLLFDAWTHRGVVIQSTPPASRVRFAMACVDDHLVLANDGDAVREVVDAWSDKAAVSYSPGFLAVTNHLPKETAQFAFVNVSQLCGVFADMISNKTGSPEMADVLRKVSEAKARTGAAVSSAPGLVAVDVVLDHDAGKEVRGMLLDALAATSTELPAMMKHLAN